MHDISSINNSRAADFRRPAVGGVVSSYASAADALAGGAIFNTNHRAADALPSGVEKVSFPTPLILLTLFLLFKHQRQLYG